jgi:hypothetical protein
VRYGEFSNKWCNQLAMLVGKNEHGETSRQLITHLELWTMMRLLVLFGARLANSIVETAQDNEGVNHWVWRMDSSASSASRGKHRITLRPVSVRSEFNVIPDAASGICNTGRTGVITKQRRVVVRKLVDAWRVDTGTLLLPPWQRTSRNLRSASSLRIGVSCTKTLGGPSHHTRPSDWQGSGQDEDRTSRSRT